MRKACMAIGMCALAIFAWSGLLGPLVSNAKASDPGFVLYGSLTKQGGGIPGVARVTMQIVRTNESITNVTDDGGYTFNFLALNAGFQPGDQMLINAVDLNTSAALYSNETVSVVPNTGESMEVNMLLERHDFPVLEDPVDPEPMGGGGNQAGALAVGPSPAAAENGLAETAFGGAMLAKPIYSPTSHGGGDPQPQGACAPQYYPLNWEIHDTVTCTDMNIVLNTNLLIFSPGALYFVRSSLTIDGTGQADGARGITIYGGGFYLDSQSLVDGLGGYPYRFDVQGTIQATGAIIRHAGPSGGPLGSGVYVHGPSAVGIFTGGAIVESGKYAGVYAQQPSTLTVSSSSVHNNGCQGIVAWDVGSLSIANAQVTGNGNGAGCQSDERDGIWFKNTLGTMSGGSASQNAGIGINVFGGRGPTIQAYGSGHVVVDNNGLNGIKIDGSSPTISYVDVDSNGMDGIWVKNSNPSISHFVVYDSWGNGVYYESSQGSLSSGSVYLNGAHGIYVLNGATPQISYVTIYGHTWVKWAGIWVKDSAPTIGPANYIYSNLYGIVVQGSMPGGGLPSIVNDNQIASNTVGVYVLTNSAANIAHNIDPVITDYGIHGNTHGIVIRGKVAGLMTTVTDNRVQGNYYYGVYVGDPTGTAEAAIDSNSVHGNSAGIGLLHASATTLVINNRVYSNNIGVTVSASSSTITGMTSCYAAYQQNAQTIWDNSMVNVLLDSGAPTVSHNCIGSNWVLRLWGQPPVWRFVPKSNYGIRVQSPSSTAFITDNLVSNHYYVGVDVQAGSPILTYNRIYMYNWWQGDGVDVRGYATPQIGRIVGGGLIERNDIYVLLFGVFLNSLYTPGGQPVKVIGNTISSQTGYMGMFGIFLYSSSTSHVVQIQANTITRFSAAISIGMSAAANINDNTVGSSGAQNYFGVYLWGYLIPPDWNPVNMPVVVQNNRIYWSMSHGIYVWCVGGFTIGDPNPPQNPGTSNQIRYNSGWGVYLKGGTTPSPGTYGSNIDAGNVWDANGNGRIRQEWMAFVTVARNPPPGYVSGANVLAHSEWDPTGQYDVWFTPTDANGKTSGWTIQYWRDNLGTQHPLNPYWQFTPYYPDKTRQCGDAEQGDMWKNREVTPLSCQP